MSGTDKIIYLVNSAEIKRRMREAKVTQRSVADALGIGPATVYVALHRGRMSAYILEVISETLGAAPWELTISPEEWARPQFGRRAFSDRIDAGAIRRLCRERQITQGELAQRLGISLPGVQLILRRGTVAPRMLPMLAAALNATEKEIQGYEEF